MQETDKHSNGDEQATTVLVVEDDEGLNHLIRKTLAKEGYKTHQALTGAEALHLLKNNSNVILLLDYILPDMNGKQVIRAIKQEKLIIPLIIMTGYGDERIAVDMMKLGAKDYIVKDPNFIEALPNVLRRILKELNTEKELVHAEKALRESETTFRALVEAAPDSVTATDIEGKLTKVSKQTLKLHGYDSEEEMLGMNAMEIIAPKDRERASANMKKAFEEGCLRNVEYTLLRKDGTTFSGELSASLIKDSLGKPKGFIATVRDITYRKLAEESLRESEEKFRSLVENAPSMIIIVDRKGAIQFINRTVPGLKIEDVIGRKQTDYIAAEYHNLVNKVIEHVCMTGEPGGYEIQGSGADGSDAWYSSLVGPIKQNGEVVAATIITTDITERKNYEKSLKDSELRYRTLCEGSADGILVADIETKKIKHANIAFCTMTGYNLEEVLSLSVMDIHPEQDLPHVISEFEAQARGEKTLATEIPCVKKDGSVFYVDINTTGIIIDGRKCNVGFFRDITDRKRAEEEKIKLQSQLLQSQKMEAIGQLAGGVAHDFNNIIGGIVGYADVLLQKLGNEPGLAKYAEKIKTAGLKASNHTRSLLSFARRSTLENQVFDVHDSIHHVVDILQHTIDKRIEIQCNLDAQRHKIIGDTGLIENMFLNICLNARDAMLQGGTLGIETKTVLLDEQSFDDQAFKADPGEYVNISITDTGAGMDEYTLQHLFEPFFTTKEQGKGTGLGLASVYGTVKQHNGYITVQSEPDRGSRFEIYLPLKE